jgi:general secretion pathway protein L
MKKPNLNKLRGVLTAARSAVARLTQLAAPATATAGDRLELWLPLRWPEQAGDIHWRLTPARGEIQQGLVKELSQLPDQARSARAHVWTSAGESVLVRVNIPTRSRAKILQALPYALEDQLLDPPESLHFAFQATAKGDLVVVVTAHSRLRGWLSALRNAGLRPFSLAPVSLALPVTPGTWAMAFTGNEIVWRGSSYTGAGCPRQSDLPPLLLAALRESPTDETPIDRLVVIGAPAELDIESWKTRLAVPLEIDTRHSVADLPFVQPPVNLLQGEYAVAGEWRDLARPYLPAAALLLLWLAGGVLSNVGEWLWLQRQHLVSQSEMKKILVTSFTETKTVIDPAQQMQRSVEQLQLRHGVQATGDLLPLLGQIAPVLQRDGRARLQSLSYVDKAITLNLSVSDEASLETLKRAFATGRLDVNVENVNRRANQIEARLRVRVKT